MACDFASEGFAIIPAVLCTSELHELIATLISPDRAGRRGLLADPRMRALAASDKLLNIVRPHITGQPAAVRAIYFDKLPGSNWLVPWHQDLTIAVASQQEIPGFGPWSVKEGIPHVQPPIKCLEQMIAVRLHLDDTDASNGALKVLPGTHRHGKLTAEQIADFRVRVGETICCAAAGDALLMRPLILHASSRSTSDRHRRVLHIEYAGFDLPEGLSWNEAA